MASTVSKRKAATKQAATKQAATKPAAAKQATASRPARKAAAQDKPARTGPAAPAAKPARRKAAPRRRLSRAASPQHFTVSHLNQADFKTEGLRPYAQYRDLGIALATNGLCQAHVIRLIPPVTDEVRKRHRHETELQLVYVLNGWIRNEFAGHGEQLMQQGSCWLQPPGIAHTVLDYSDDCELLEIIVPADFKTVEV